MKLWYPSIEECIAEIFPLIRDRLNQDHGIPYYEKEPRGMDGLETTLTFVQSRRYKTFHKKAAYLVCSIVTGHGFSNGNKRLAATVLLAFLIYNSVKIRRTRYSTYKEWIIDTFPAYVWDDTISIGDLHLTFLYHLATALADRPTWKEKTFDGLRSEIAEFFGRIYDHS